MARTNDASGAYYHEPDDQPRPPDIMMSVPPQEIKFHRIPMPPEVRAALIFALAVVFCITGLIAYLIYAVS